MSGLEMGAGGRRMEEGSWKKGLVEVGCMKRVGGRELEEGGCIKEVRGSGLEKASWRKGFEENQWERCI